MRAWLLLASVTALAGCNGENNANSRRGAASPDALLGRWVSERHIGDCVSRRVRVELRAEGVLVAGGEPGTWRIEGDRLVLTSTEPGAEAAETVRYRIDGDRIHTLDGNDRGEALVRCGSPTASALQAERRSAPDPVNITGSPLDDTEFIDNGMPTSNEAGM